MNDNMENMEFDNPSQVKSLRSIAISLKRIADVISETPAEKEHRFKKYMESLGFKE